jgi:hypothetical protein
MSIKQKGSPDIPSATDEPSRPGMVRRLFNSWRRIEDAFVQMDYGPYDHMTDRLRSLETRVAALEGRPNPLTEA